MKSRLLFIVVFFLILSLIICVWYINRKESNSYVNNDLDLVVNSIDDIGIPRDIEENIIIHNKITPETTDGYYREYGDSIMYFNDEVNADINTFEYIGHGLAKDKDFYYYGNIPFGGIERDAYIVGEGYLLDSDNVVSLSGIEDPAHVNVTFIDDADPDTFEVMDNGYARDKNGLIFEGKHYPNIDPDSFREIGYLLYQDKFAKYKVVGMFGFEGPAILEKVE